MGAAPMYDRQIGAAPIYLFYNKLCILLILKLLYIWSDFDIMYSLLVTLAKS